MKYKFNVKVKPTTSEFWYDLSDGGYLKPKDFTNDKETLKSIKEAISLLKKLESMCIFN